MQKDDELDSMFRQKRVEQKVKLRANTYPSMERVCAMCSDEAVEDTAHLVMHCAAYEAEREEMLRLVESLLAANEEGEAAVFFARPATTSASCCCWVATPTTRRSLSRS